MFDATDRSAKSAWESFLAEARKPNFSEAVANLVLLMGVANLAAAIVASALVAVTSFFGMFTRDNDSPTFFFMFVTIAFMLLAIFMLLISINARLGTIIAYKTQENGTTAAK